ncbi:MAG: endonuclease/exonuclease/phosphatase family protein [Planctomycetota bacterium]|nr:endonuclease/exonuclease/phosphatase family protein [Planctomycetota bacterium]
MTSTRSIAERSRRFTLGRVALFVVLIAAFFALDGNERVPTSAAEGDSFNGAQPASRPSGDILRVAELNIAGGVGKADNRLDLDRTAAAIHGYDLIGLEEVHGADLLASEDQAQILGEKLNLPWLYAPVERRWWKDSFGNAAITSLRVDHWQRIPISAEDASTHRNVLMLRVDLNGRPLNVLITHLDRKDDRPHELRAVITLFESLREPAILMGDLNSDPSDPRIAALQKEPGVGDPVGQALGDKVGANLDWIFTRGFRVNHSGITDNGASDHYLAWAELELNPVK